MGKINIDGVDYYEFFLTGLSGTLRHLIQCECLDSFSDDLREAEERRLCAKAYDEFQMKKDHKDSWEDK